jgi:hypothetical protein
MLDGNDLILAKIKIFQNTKIFRKQPILLKTGNHQNLKHPNSLKKSHRQVGFRSSNFWLKSHLSLYFIKFDCHLASLQITLKRNETFFLIFAKCLAACILLMCCRTFFHYALIINYTSLISVAKQWWNHFIWLDPLVLFSLSSHRVEFLDFCMLISVSIIYYSLTHQSLTRLSPNIHSTTFSSIT